MFIHSPIAGYLGCFQFAATMKKSIKLTFIFRSFCGHVLSFFLCKYHRNGITV